MDLIFCIIDNRLAPSEYDIPIERPVRDGTGMAEPYLPASGGMQELQPQTLRYPVLKCIMPYISSFLTQSEACNLLELYFTSLFDTKPHPICRHIHAFIFRKQSILHPTNPRTCSPALLASMLSVAAQTGGDDMLSWSHVRRQDVDTRLCNLTIQLLRPLVHADIGKLEPYVADIPARTQSVHTPMDSVWDGPGTASPFNDQGTLDDVITYVHIATLISATERKSASMRWWHAAFSLARELKLHVEAPPGPTNFPLDQNSNNLAAPSGTTTIAPWWDLSSFDFDKSLSSYLDNSWYSSQSSALNRSSEMHTEERREERRRTWWLLYIQDRHLALCYNRHLALTDAESSDLLLPLDEETWQSGTFVDIPESSRRRFPSFRCTGHSLYGFFLPLMTIVGEILDHNHGKQHPFLGEQYRMAPHAKEIAEEISRQLDTYKESLSEFESTHVEPHFDSSDTLDQDMLQTRMVVGYANFTIHVCHILLQGECDPVSLFDDKDFWIQSPTFTSTISHAIEAADELAQILDHDPGLCFMPYFMGIFFLQSSFVLLLIIDRMQTRTDPRVIGACETIIRATEVCVATLDAEYQRNYRQILRSAVAQARGRYVPEKTSQYRRRTVLELYRWTRNGTGLAL